MLKMFSLLVFLVSVLIINCSADVVLPSTINPLHYDIFIEPNLDALTFNGITTIILKIDEETDVIQLNAKDLTISDQSLIQSSDSKSIDIIDVVSEDADTISIKLNTKIQAGLYDLKLTFNGKINNDHQGLYVSTYKQNNIERKILLSNLRYNKARQVFPCFDDPKFPATFSITIRRPNNLKSVSNMPLSRQVTNTDTVDDTFARTDAMVTYLLSIALVDFNDIADNHVYVYSADSAKAEAILVETNNYIEKIASASGKQLSFVIVPDDMLCSKMQVNPGIALIRESVMDHSGSSEDRVVFYLTLANIISQQFVEYNNYDDWWANLWSKEAAASIKQYEIIDDNLKDIFTFDFVKNGMENDVGNAAISLEIESAETADDLLNNPAFQAKSYSIYQMIQNLPKPGIITENVLFKTWPKGIGYPLIDARRTSNTSLILSQKPMSYSGFLWPVPINFGSQNVHDYSERPTFEFIMDTETRNIDILDDGLYWKIVNINGIGYYRVNYDADNWSWISNSLRAGFLNTISTLNRAQLIDDALASVLWQSLPIDTYLSLVQYISSEEQLVPLLTFFKTVTRLNTLLTGTEAQTKFISFATQLTSHLFKKVGVESSDNELISEKIQRIRTLKWLCKFEHNECQTELSKALTSLPDYVHPDFEEYVYCGGLYQSDLAVFKDLVEKYSVSGSKRILRALTCTSNEEMLQIVVDGLIDDSIQIKLDDSHKMEAFQALVDSGETGVNLLLNSIKRNWGNYVANFCPKQLNAMLIALSQNLVTAQQEESMIEIMDCVENPDMFTKTFDNVKENIQMNRQWASELAPAVSKWIDENILTTTTSTSTSTSTTTTTETPPKPSPDTPKPENSTTPKPDNGAVVSKLENILILICVFVVPFLINTQ